MSKFDKSQLTTCVFTFILLSLIVFNSPVYAGNHFINVTSSDYYSVWTNGTNILENQFLDNTTYYNGTFRGLIYNVDVNATPAGEIQTDDVTFFLQGSDYGSFWNHKLASGYKVRYNAAPFITGLDDQPGLLQGLFLDGQYVILGPYPGPITVFHVRAGLFLGGFTMVFGSLGYIAYKKPRGDIVIKLSMVILIGFALLLAMVDTL